MTDNYKTILHDLDEDILVAYHDDERFSTKALFKARDDVISSLESDNGKMRDSLRGLLLLDCRSPLTINAVSSFIDSYLEDGSGTTMPMLLADLFEFFNISNSNWKEAAMAVGVYAEIHHDLEYHNNAHFKKVVLHMARLIMAHNHIFENTSHILKPDKVALLLIASAVHDLGHDGTGNIIDRKYILARTEKRSFDIVRPALVECGLTNKVLDDLLLLLMATDVSPFEDPLSPANQVRAAYDIHFGEDEENENEAEEIEFLKEFEPFRRRSMLCVMALMLHEADIMNSAAVNYETTKKESCSISLETGRKNALPEDTLLFLNKICNEEMLSSAAQLVGSKAMDDIREKIKEDFKNGNSSYI